MQNPLLKQLCGTLRVPYWLHTKLQRSEDRETIVRLLEHFEEAQRRRPC